MARTIVGVLRGGTSSEYDLSLLSGAAVLSSLPDDRYETRDIFIDRNGTWHLRGMPAAPARALSQVDVVVSALHGGTGEDGTVQRILDRAGVPYTGSRPLPSALSLNKIRAREIFRESGIRIPNGVWFSVEDGQDPEVMSRAVFSVFGPPYVVKPANEGAATGILIADTIRDLPATIARILHEYGAAIVEEFVRGKEATVGVIENFRNEKLYALPPAEVRLPEGFRTMQPVVHQLHLMDHAVPSDFSFEQKDKLADAARSAHKALGLSHFSRSDFILTPRGPYLLETNALPGLYEGAAFTDMLKSVGSSLPEFLTHSIGLARA